MCTCILILSEIPIDLAEMSLPYILCEHSYVLNIWDGLSWAGPSKPHAHDVGTKIRGLTEQLVAAGRAHTIKYTTHKLRFEHVFCTGTKS